MRRKVLVSTPDTRLRNYVTESQSFIITWARKFAKSYIFSGNTNTRKDFVHDNDSK